MVHGHFRYTGAGLDHFSGNFMSEHQGFADFEIQDSAFVVVMQVGSADSSGTETY
jgi:hypothetical protein